MARFGALMALRAITLVLQRVDHLLAHRGAFDAFRPPMLNQFAAGIFSREQCHHWRSFLLRGFYPEERPLLTIGQPPMD
jgi:hypothetical protein